MRRALGWLALVVAVGSCAAAKKLSQGQIPTEGEMKQAVATVKKIHSLSEEVRPDQEYYVGRAVATNILAKHEYRYLDKPAIARGELDGLTQYVNLVGQVVVAGAMEARHSGDRPAPVAGWHFTVVESQSVNAFAAPGGYIFVTTAAVQTAKSEDELAALLAHEVAHVMRGHALGSIKQSRYADVSSDLLQQAGTASLSPEQVAQLNKLMEGIIDDTINAMFVKGYSRDTEFEADKLALEYLAKSGYDPSALNRYLDSLAARQETSKGGFYDTHPSTADRKAKLGAAVAIAVPKVRTTRFQKELARLK